MPAIRERVSAWLGLCVRDAYLWACERLYHEAAWSYDGVSRVVSLGQWPAWRRLVLEEVQRTAGAGETGGAGEMGVLELGFGTGELLAEMAGGAWRVVGLELSGEMQALAARRLAAVPNAAARVQAQAERIPFAAGSFDAILATFPAPYILERATLVECVRVLRGGGRLVIGGLWVEAVQGVQRWLPVFYGRPAAAQIAAIEARVSEAGFHVRWCVHGVGGVSVPVLVGEKRDGAR